MLNKILNNKYLHLLFFFILAFIVRFWYVDKTSIGSDEGFSIFVSQYTITEIINILSTGDNPPLWEILLHFWCELFGGTELAVRMLSLFFNVLTIIPIYLIGCTFFNTKNSILVSLLFIFSSFSLFISHEARVYSLIGLLSTLSMLVFLNFIHNQGKKTALFWLTFFNVLLLYSHYLSAWIILVQAITFLILYRKHCLNVFHYLFHLLLIVIAFSPLISVLYVRFLDSGVHGTWVSKVTGADALYYMLWEYLNKPIVVIFSIVFLVTAFVKFIIKRNIISSNNLVIHLWCWLPLIVSFLLSFKVSFFLDRYLYFIVPGLYFSITLAINYVIINKKWNLIVSFMLVVIMAISFRIDSSKMGYSGHHSNTKLIANIFFKLSKDKKTQIITCPDWYEKELMYYLDRKTFFSKTKIEDINNVFRNQLLQMNISLIDTYKDIRIKKGIKRIVYFDNNCDFHCQENQVFKHLNDHFVFNYHKIIDGKKMSFFTFKN